MAGQFRIEHPRVIGGLVLVTFVAAVAFFTYSFASRPSASVCDRALGRVRIEIASADAPPLNASGRWETISKLVDDVGASCPLDVADRFERDEFEPWASKAPAEAPPVSTG